MSRGQLSRPCRSRCEHVGYVSGRLTPALVKAACDRHRCDWCGRTADTSLWLCLHADCGRLACGEPLDHSQQHFGSTQPPHCLALNADTMRVWCYLCRTEVFLENNEPPLSETLGQQPSDSVPDAGRPPSSRPSADHDADDSPDDDDPPLGLTGLRNIGNTCYLNATLQALSNLPPLTGFFLDCGALATSMAAAGGARRSGGGSLARSYTALLQQMWSVRRHSSMAPSGVLHAVRLSHPQFRGFNQHDSQELLRCLMDALHDELRQPVLLQPELSSPAAAAAADSDSDAAPSDVDDVSRSDGDDEDEDDYETADSGLSDRSTESSPDGERRRRRRAVRPVRCSPRSGGSPTHPPDGGQGDARGVSDAPPARYRYRSIVSDLLDGRLLSSVQCLTCGRVSSTHETFQDLSLPIPSGEQLTPASASPASSAASLQQMSAAEAARRQGWLGWLWGWLVSWMAGPTVSLHDCLASFFSSDELKGDNMYSCGNCKKLRNGVKYSRVLELPEVLTVHLKRFRHELLSSAKLGTYVSFPLEGLDLSGYMQGRVSQVTRYDLAAVICHHGTAGAGHYTTYALNHYSDLWYEYDDLYVTEASAETVARCQAYVLFYRKSCPAARQRRLRASEIISRAPSSASLMSYYVSRQWINRFNTFAEPGPIDNGDVLCEHGGVRPDLSVPLQDACVRVSRDAWEYLHGSLGGGPVAHALHPCPQCHADWQKLVERRKHELAAFQRHQQQAVSASHALAADWFRRWEQFACGRRMEPPGRIDNAIIAAPTHGANAQLRAGSDHVKVSADLWHFFLSTYDGGPEVPLISTASGKPTRSSGHSDPHPQRPSSSPTPASVTSAMAVGSVEERSNTPSAIMEQRPSAPATIMEQRPSTPATIIEQRPSTPATIMEQRPSAPATIMEQRPSTPSIEQRPSTPSMEQRPSTPSMEQRPSTPSLEQKPSTPSMEQRPSTPSIEQRHSDNGDMFPVSNGPVFDINLVDRSPNAKSCQADSPNQDPTISDQESEDAEDEASK